MALDYKNLVPEVRQLMTTEIDGDLAKNTLYKSGNLSPQGQVDYPDLLKGAAANGTDSTLAAQILPRLNSHEKPRQLKSGALSKPPIMRSNAHEMLAEGEFNRYYIRGVCLRAIELGHADVTVYRAKAVENPRPDSEPKIGTTVNAASLLADLRNNIGLDTALGLPAGPNSGLCVYF
ncbi:hypothetical protein [Granulicella rosea]|uniref:hypothetical protein n=1 Tax=Granulicella rosea TaxID=474952 RepID=UPI00115EABFE|nr:hypothetical protein [Granulicella rosea]